MGWGRLYSHLSACVLSEVLPADVGHDPCGQCIPQHVNHGAEAVPSEPKWPVSRDYFLFSPRVAGGGQCSPRQHWRPAARPEPTAR